MIGKIILFCVFATVSVVFVESRPVDDTNTSPPGAPFFDEIVVESTLTVRGKGGAARQSRGKMLQLAALAEEMKNKTKEAAAPDAVPAAVDLTAKPAPAPAPALTISSDGASVQLKRTKRQQQFQGPRHRNNNFGGGHRGHNNVGRFPGQGFPSSSASSANAASQGFNVAGPNGFGASASNAGTQNFQFGPKGISGSAGQAASQTYRLPNGSTINVALSNGFNFGQNGASQSNSNAVSITRPDGQQQFFRG